MAFTEQNKNGVLFHQSDLLAKQGGIVHAFTTRVGGVSEGVYDSLNLRLASDDDPSRVRENYNILARAVGFPVERLTLPDQQHTCTVRAVDERDAGKGLFRERDYKAVDALVTNTPNLPIITFSADCGIAVFYDPAARCIGAAHAGWRGTAGGIMARTVETMCGLYGARPETIRAAIGACIDKCCFETDDDVEGAMHGALGDAAAQFCAHDGKKWHIDLKAINRHHLLQSGVRAENIDISPLCTACNTGLYWSHRLLGERRGAQAGVIMLLE